jgi:type II secretory pathway predicted ATPase ExeA
MYLQHFKLKFAPFERDIAPEFLYHSRQFDEALARLSYSCQKRTMVVITGEPGTGKSTLIRLLVERLDPNCYCFIYLADSQLSPRNFYVLTLTSLGLQTPGQLPKLKNLFKQTLLDLYENQGKTTVIAIDEAQTLEMPMLYELRFALNFKLDSFSPLALILLGQSEFRGTLHAFHMNPIARRVDTSFHLTGMDLQETKIYIGHQLKNAGCDRPLFPDDVISRIQERSKGITSGINLLCKGCLLDAASRNQELIDAENLNRVLNDLV